MSDPYVVFGLPADADDAAIRKRYLELVRQFTPEQQPEKFAEIRAAYESLKDLDTRLRRRLFDDGAGEDIAGIIEELTCRTPRRRPSLTALVATVNRR